MQKNKNTYLKAMEIDVWKTKQLSSSSSINTKEANVVQNSANTIKTNMDPLKQTVANCTLCDLCKTRTQTVFGVGNQNADIMLIGEAPGENEDKQGEPFVGRAGMLLNEMIKSIKLERKDVYIANILKCRPPNNRDPSPKEIELCTPYLKQQIAAIKPKVLIAVGRIAAQHLLNTDVSMGKLRGNIYHYGDNQTPLFVIYHPAYLLRSPGEKVKAYQDMIKIYDFLQSLSCRGNMRATARIAPTGRP